MRLETTPWPDKRPAYEPDKGGRPPVQRCEHQDCFTCPYDDCIINMRELLRREKEERQKAKQSAQGGKQKRGGGHGSAADLV